MLHQVSENLTRWMNEYADTRKWNQAKDVRNENAFDALLARGDLPDETVQIWPLVEANKFAYVNYLKLIDPVDNTKAYHDRKSDEYDRQIIESNHPTVSFDRYDEFGEGSEHENATMTRKFVYPCKWCRISRFYLEVHSFWNNRPGGNRSKPKAYLWHVRRLRRRLAPNSSWQWRKSS